VPNCFFVRIIFGMTGVAIAGRAFENIIDMAVGARHTDMFSGQFEAGQIVVEGSRLPPVGGVTDTAICAERTIVGIIFLMAGDAVLVCGF
jgi:hypothetical protein